MKKFLLTVLLIMFTSLSANATYSVSFGNTGRPAFVSHGGGMPRSMHNFGSNAAFTPRNRVYAGIRNREIQRQKAVTRAIRSMASQNCGNSNYNYQRTMGTTRNSVAVQNQVSRFDRNYTVRTQKSYTRGGVTYYN